MNPRQRRGVLLILVTILGAVVTFVAVFSYVQSVSSQVGPMTTVLKLSQQVTELKEIKAEDVVGRAGSQALGSRRCSARHQGRPGKGHCGHIQQRSSAAVQHASGPSTVNRGIS